MGEAKRILFVANDLDFLLAHRLPLAIGAREAGYEVHLASPRQEVPPAIAELGFPLHTLPLSRRGIHPWRELGSIWNLIKLFRSFRPHLVHLVTIKPVIYGGIAARLVRVPGSVFAVSGLGYIFLSNKLSAAFLRTLVKIAYRISFRHPNSRAVFENAEDRQTLLKLGIVSAGQAVLSQGCGVDSRIFAPGPRPAGDPIVLLAARMIWDKGIGDFVAAAVILRERGVKARFVLVGAPDPGNPRAVPPEQLERWQREGAIEWWGQRDDMPETLVQATVFCLPSAYGEGRPRALIEAAACGLPIVTTDWRGCRDVVADGVNGLLVPIHDPDALAEALSRLIEDPALRARMGAKGREIAVRDYTEAGFVQETLDIYRALLS